MEESEHLKKLEEIIPRLKVKDEHNCEVTYESDGEGTFIGFGLHKEKGVAVQRVFMSKGTNIPEHQHSENEYALCYSGKFELITEGNNVMVNGTKSESPHILTPGDAAFFPPDTKHSAIILKDTWIVCVTIPASEEYPDAK